jgi:signal peptidase II
VVNFPGSVKFPADKFIMAVAEPIFSKPNQRIFALAAVIFALDQLTKWLVLKTIPEYTERTVIPGFFNLIIALAALVVLWFSRRHFSAHRLLGQLAFGLIFGGIIGNLTDRLLPGRHAVVDFLHFYMARRGSMEVWDFPAFNVADSAICTGVALIFLLNWKNEPPVTSNA